MLNTYAIKCPKCGADWQNGGGCTLDGRGPWTAWKCGTAQYGDDIEEPVGCLRRQLEQAKAEYEVLPEWTCLILAERRRQDEKWGEQNHDDLRWLAILTEEVGELAKCIVEGKGGVAELVHVAAVSAAWIEAVGRRAKRGEERP